MASDLHPWRFELEIFQSRLPCGHVFEPKLNAQQGAICEAFFFFNCFEQSTSWCFGSHFFVARSHRFIAIWHCRFLASFFIFFKRKSMERKLLCQLFTATNCSALAQHALKMICQTTLIQFCSSHYWAMRVSCLVVFKTQSYLWLLCNLCIASEHSQSYTVAWIYIRVISVFSFIIQR